LQYFAGFTVGGVPGSFHGISLGLNGIIEDMIQKCDYSTIENVNFKNFAGKVLKSVDLNLGTVFLI
jgi:hypothetical protein